MDDARSSPVSLQDSPPVSRLESQVGSLLNLIAAQVETARRRLDNRFPTNEADAAVLDQLARALTRVSFDRPPPPSTHIAVERWLQQAVAFADPNRPETAEAFQGCAPFLHWNQSYVNEKPTPTMERFWPNYSYASLVVPPNGATRPAPCRSDELALFLIVQGPDVVYGRHHHPATEIYGVVAGTANWLRGKDGYRRRKPGEVFVHHPSVVHATTTLDQPTISWAAWLGDLDTDARMAGR